MNIGILGTGIVGQTLGLKLVHLGHSVKLGTRYPANLDELKGRGTSARTLKDWLAEAGSNANVGAFHEAASFGEFIINALRGAVSVEVLRSIGEAHLHSKIFIDTANPIDLSRGFPLTLFVKDTDSLGEVIQRAFPHSGSSFICTLAPGLPRSCFPINQSSQRRLDRMPGLTQPASEMLNDVQQLSYVSRQRTDGYIQCQCAGRRSLEAPPPERRVFWAFS